MLRRAYLFFALLLISACTSHQTVNNHLPQKVTPQLAAGDEVSMSAMSLIGVPYVWGGNTPDSGFDCSGLIVYVYRGVGINLPRTTMAMSHLSSPSIKKTSALKTGDLVFFSTGRSGKVSHAGIYVGNGRFIHAPSSGGAVKLSNLHERYWSRTFLLGKRIVSN